MTRPEAMQLARQPSIQTAAPKGRRYTVPTMVRAKQLREAGWSLDRIADLLECELGVRPHVDTIAIWTIPSRARSYEQSVKRADRRRRNANATGRMPNAARFSADFQLIRAKGLRAAGLSVEAVAKAMSFDFPESPVSKDQVRHALEDGRWPGS